jgi:hypothetical protein
VPSHLLQVALGVRERTVFAEDVNYLKLAGLALGAATLRQPVLPLVRLRFAIVGLLPVISHPHCHLSHIRHPLILFPLDCPSDDLLEGTFELTDTSAEVLLIAHAAIPFF